MAPVVIILIMSSVIVASEKGVGSSIRGGEFKKLERNALVLD